MRKVTETEERFTKKIGSKTPDAHTELRIVPVPPTRMETHQSHSALSRVSRTMLPQNGMIQPILNILRTHLTNLINKI